MDLKEIGLAAVDRFITTWNSRDPEAWAGSLNFPHVRPSPVGRINVADTAEIYASRVDYARVIATGWDHSEWDYRHVVHTSASKIHVAGQWSRYNAEGQIIHTNPITYVVTHHDGEWGIQSRFAADYAGDDADTSGLENRGFKLIKDFLTQFNQGNRAACAELLNYPHFTVHPGELQRTDEPSGFEIADNKVHLTSLQALQVGNQSMNAALEVDVEDASGTHPLQAVMNLTIRDDHLGIQATSFLDPNEPVE